MNNRRPVETKTNSNQSQLLRVSLRIGVALSLLFGPPETFAQSSKVTSAVDLPKHVPKLTGPDGLYTSEGMRFTTKAYEREAFRLILNEANTVAKQMRLDETLPLTSDAVVRAFVVGFGMSRTEPKSIGMVATQNYGYYVSVDHKLSFIESARQDENMFAWNEKFRLPFTQLDTNAAYQLATQWLTSAQMDIEKLNMECSLTISPDEAFIESNGSTKTFLPLYSVSWKSDANRKAGYGAVASVKVFPPIKKLVSLRVSNGAYINRPEIQFTNLNDLLSQP